MQLTSKSARRAPLFVVLAVAASLLVPVTANAAMGGANGITTTLRPDLRSATVQSINIVDDTTTVRVCFDKAIASLPLRQYFALGTYRDDDVADRLVASSATRSTAQCADAIFPDADATQYTNLGVRGSDGSTPASASSAVATNGFGNIDDSIALIGSSTHNGTRGFTTGPDLIGISPINVLSQVDFTFDQRVAGVTGVVACAGCTDGTTAPAFAINDATGAETQSVAGATNRTISGDLVTIRVQFPAGSVTNAVRGFVRRGAVAATANRNGPNGVQLNGLRSVARPNSGGATDRPDLVNATLAPDGSYVDFQYDAVITAVSPTLSDFVVGSSAADFKFSPSVAPTVVGGIGVGNTVRVVPTAGVVSPTNFHEFFVEASSAAGAVTSAGGASTAGGIPLGGNAGAFAQGFTVGPEALSVAFDNVTSQATIRFDQRWQTETLANFKLIDDQGSQVAAGAVAVSGGGNPGASQALATVTFPAGTVTGARSLLLQGDAVRTNTAFSFSNQPQAISPTAPAAVRNKRAKFHRVKVVRVRSKRNK